MRTKPKSSNRLRVLRAERRITQIDLARRVRINPTRYWQIENGYTEPSKDERAAIARVFDVAPDAVFPSEAVAP